MLYYHSVMNINSITLHNTQLNKQLFRSVGSNSNQGTLQKIQEASTAFFRTISSFVPFKFCPRKKKSISFSPKVDLTVFRREEPVVADKERFELSMSLKHDFKRPVQVHHQLVNLGYKEPQYDKKDRTVCNPSLSQKLDKIVLEYYPFSKGLKYYTSFIDSILSAEVCSESDAILALKAYIYLLMWNRVCGKSQKNEEAQTFSEWAVLEFTERYLQNIHLKDDKVILLDQIQQAIAIRNVDQEDHFTLKEFIRCERTRPWDLRRDPHFNEHCKDVIAKRWGHAEIRSIYIKKWPSSLMKSFEEVVNQLKEDKLFNLIITSPNN